MGTHDINILDFDDGILYKIFKYCVKSTSLSLVLTCNRFHSVVVYFIKLLNVYQKHVNRQNLFCEKLIKLQKYDTLCWFFENCSLSIAKDIFESDFVHYFQRGVNFKLIQTLQKLINFTLSDWKKITHISIEFGDLALFHHCLKIIPNSNNFNLNTKIFAKELIQVDNFSWNQQLKDEINKPDERKDDSWISICVVNNRFDFIESLDSYKLIYSKLNDRFWTISLLKIFDRKESNKTDKTRNIFGTFQSVISKYQQLYNRDLVLKITTEWEILSIVQSNDTRIFEFCKDAISEIDPTFEKTKSFIIDYSINNLFYLVFDSNFFISKRFLTLTSLSLFFPDVKIFEYVLRHRNLSDITDEELWVSIIKFGDVSLIQLAKELIPTKPSYYASEIKSLKIAQMLVDMKIPIDWIKIKTPETLVWLIQNNLVYYQHIKKDGLYFLAMIEEGDELLKIIQKQGDLEESMWFYIDFNNIHEIYSFVQKNYLRFLKKCFKLLPELPEISSRISDIVFFAYDSNDIMIFDFLLNHGYDLFKIPSFLESISFYADDFNGFSIWKRYKSY